MKVLALVLLVVGSTCGLGSGPYLPSGWKPAGPAFYLPTELEKPAEAAPKSLPIKESKEYEPLKVQIEETDDPKVEDPQDPAPVPLKDAPLQESGVGTLDIQITDAAQAQVESEASGSDAFREYGPPKEVSINITQQALPDTMTEQAFVVIETESETQNESNAEIFQQGKTEVETQTESSLAVEDETTEKLAEVTEVEVAEVTQVNVTQEDAEDSNVVATEQKSVEVADVKAVEVGVENIAEALVKLENEIKAQQVQTKEEAGEVKSVVQGSTQNGPEGFLEYGPPSFAEYGPPKGDLTLTAEEKAVATNEISETRRRRYSPKFRTPKRKN